MSRDDERDVTMTVEISAAPDAVWRALTDAGELTRWFPLEAKVEPGEGGSWWIGWPPGPWQFSCDVATWQPGRRLELVERRDDPAAAGHVLRIDFRLEESGGATRLTVVHSGFGRGAEWDDEYHGVERGWRYELRCLAHYLDRHRGRDRATAWLVESTGVPADEVFARLTGVDGFEPDPAMLALAVGDRVRLRTPLGGDHAGAVLAAARPGVELDPVDASVGAPQQVGHADAVADICAGLPGGLGESGFEHRPPRGVEGVDAVAGRDLQVDDLVGVVERGATDRRRPGRHDPLEHPPAM